MHQLTFYNNSERYWNKGILLLSLTLVCRQSKLFCLFLITICIFCLHFCLWTDFCLWIIPWSSWLVDHFFRFIICGSTCGFWISSILDRSVSRHPNLNRDLLNGWKATHVFAIFGKTQIRNWKNALSKNWSATKNVPPTSV